MCVWTRVVRVVFLAKLFTRAKAWVHISLLINNATSIRGKWEWFERVQVSTRKLGSYHLSQKVYHQLVAGTNGFLYYLTVNVSFFISSKLCINRLMFLQSWMKLRYVFFYLNASLCNRTALKSLIQWTFYASHTWSTYMLWKSLFRKHILHVLRTSTWVSNPTRFISPSHFLVFLLPPFWLKSPRLLIYFFPCIYFRYLR